VHLRLVNRGRAWTLAVWATAAAVYISIGVFVTDFMLSVFVAVGYLLVATWLLPTLLRRFL
jgi:hypothetical protein